MSVKYNISQEILDLAKNCDKNFACLAESDNPSCKIASCINEVYFLEKLERVCPFNMHFGNNVICNCPVRLEIYRKYGE